MMVVESVQKGCFLGKNDGKWQVTCTDYSSVHSLFYCLFSQLGIKKKKYMPYNHQHKYFFISEYLHSPATLITNGAYRSYFGAAFKLQRASHIISVLPPETSRLKDH